jgi:hypothetical protein
MLLFAFIVCTQSKTPIILQRYFDRVAASKSIFVRVSPTAYYEKPPTHPMSDEGGQQAGGSDLVFWYEHPHKFRDVWQIWNGDRGISLLKNINAMAPPVPKSWEDVFAPIESPLLILPEPTEGESPVWTESNVQIEGVTLNSVRLQMESTVTPGIPTPVDITWVFDKSLNLNRVQFRSTVTDGTYLSEMVVKKMILGRKFPAGIFDLDHPIRNPQDPAS